MAAPSFPPAPPLTVYRARGFWSRLGGLLARPELRKGEALHLVPCTAVHTFFMPYHIDVVFVDRAGRVLRIVSDMEPWRAAFCSRAHAALELRAGQAAQHGIVQGALLDQTLVEGTLR